MSDPFDHLADTYEDVLATSTGQLSRDGRFYQAKLECMLACIPELANASRILDFGCGIGKLTVLLAKAFANAEVCCYDPSPKSLQAAAAACQTAPNVRPIDNLSEEAGFGLIVAANVFHHIQPPARAEELGQLSRQLAHGGRLVIFEHNPYNPFTRLVVARCPMDRDAVLIPRSEFARLASQQGLSVERQAYFLLTPFRGALIQGIERSLARLPIAAQYMLSLCRR